MSHWGKKEAPDGGRIEVREMLRGVYLPLDELVYMSPFQSSNTDRKDSVYTGDMKAALLLLGFLRRCTTSTKAGAGPFNNHSQVLVDEKYS